jgi:sortase A
MTARVIVRNPALGRIRPAMLVEYFLLFAGLIALDYFIWMNVRSTFYQAYESWSFSQTLNQRPANIRGFAAAEIESLFHSSRSAVSTPDRASMHSPAPLRRALPALSVIGRLDIPRLRVDAIVREGVERDTLDKAVGHVPSTALPGEAGNVGLAGHRDTFFRALRNVRKSDRIRLETLHGSYEYEVESTKVVSPRDVGVLSPSRTGPTLTLITCYPFYYVGSAPNRFIVRARQVEASPPPQPRTGS